MAKLGVPLVDAGRIVEGQEWASRVTDGRHYPPLVPLECIALLNALTSPPPPPYLLEKGQTDGAVDGMGDGHPDVAITVGDP